MSHGGHDLVGKIVPESEVAADLGFKDLEDFRAWNAAGSPTGRCGNTACYRPAFWPNLDKPCKYCGAKIALDEKWKPKGDSVG